MPRRSAPGRPSRRPAVASLLLALLVAVLPLGAWAEESPAAPTGQLTKPPELLEFVQAPYPPEAEGQRLEGDVGLLVDIDEHGAVTRVEVVEPAGHGFDEAAVEAVKQFRFSPAEIDGAPAAVRLGYRYSFVLAPEEPTREERISVVNLRGTVLVRGTREPLANAIVSVAGGEFGATTDEQGHFEIADVPLGRHPVSVMASGFETFETEEEIVEGKVTEVTYYARKSLYSQYQTVVRGKRERKEVAQIQLQQEEIRLIPGTQGDALKVVQNLPGVARAPYGFGLLAVRGGKPNDTRVFLDGVWVPLLFHFGGLTSVFNADLVNDIAFQPGNFSARNGRATAGVVEAETRQASQKGYHGYVNLNVVDATALVEGPLTDDLSFAISARRSHVDQALKLVLPDDIGFNFIVAPVYWDYQAKLDYAPRGRHRYELMLFGSSDDAQLLLDNPALIDPEGRGEIGFGIQFHRLVGRMESRLAPSLRHRAMASAGVDLVTSSVGQDIGTWNRNWVGQFRNALTWEALPSLSLEAGTDNFIGWVDYEYTAPPFPAPNAIPDPIVSRQLVTERNGVFLFEPALYLEAVWKPFSGTRLIPGVRFDYERTLGYFTVDPRLSVFQQLGASTLLKGGIGIYQQPPDFRLGQWTQKVGNPYLGPERALHTMVGVEQQITEAIGLDVQLYYKRLTNLAQQSSGTVVRDGVEVPERWNNGAMGRSYGVEILLRHALTRNFFGWIAYGLARSEMLDVYSRDGGYRPFALDQPHNLVVVASYKWPLDWITGLRFRYSSGALRTPVQGSLYDSDADAYFPIPGSPFAERGPAFMQLDLRVDKRLVFDDWMLSVYLDIQNVTNYGNVESVLYNYDFSRTRNLQGLPIVPSLGVKGEF